MPMAFSTMDHFGPSRCSDGQTNGNSVYPPTLMNNWRAAAKSATGHEIGVLTGGIQMETHRGPPIRFCHGCNNEVVPATSHFLWECPASGHMRRFVNPGISFWPAWGGTT